MGDLIGVIGAFAVGLVVDPLRRWLTAPRLDMGFGQDRTSYESRSRGDRRWIPRIDLRPHPPPQQIVGTGAFMPCLSHERRVRHRRERVEAHSLL